MSDFDQRIALLASDRESGASEIVDEAVAILRDALQARTVLAVARALCRAQPTMAPIWNASLAALEAVEAPERFEEFAARVARAPRALTRFAIEHLALGGDAARPLRLVTLSFSRSVAVVLETLAEERAVRVACSEARPALEGRRLAARLSGAGVPVTCFSDAAVAQALASADAVLVGADAVASEWFLNKSGTRMLATTASQQGVPLYVVASRDKFVGHALSAHIRGKEGAPEEIWEAPPTGVTVRNPYFEPTPAHLITAVMSDVGLLTPAMLADACEASAARIPPDLLDRLMG